MAMHDRLEEWVGRRMAASPPPPGWPSEDSARRRLQQRVAKRRLRLVVSVCVSATVCAILLLAPQPRAVAERLWDQIFLGRPKVLILDHDGAAVGSFSPELEGRAEPRPVPSGEEAARAAGFTPHVPEIPLFATSPSYSVADVMSARLRLRTSAIRHFFVRAGGSASAVPDAWNGAVLEVLIGPVIIADFGGVVLLQSRPFQLITPANFDLKGFYRIAFRSLGMNEQDARTLSTDLALSPAWLTFMPKEDEGLVHEFETRRGTGLLIEKVYGQGKTLAIWSGSDRLYALLAATEDITAQRMKEVANAFE